MRPKFYNGEGNEVIRNNNNLLTVGNLSLCRLLLGQREVIYVLRAYVSRLNQMEPSSIENALCLTIQNSVAVLDHFVPLVTEEAAFRLRSRSGDTFRDEFIDVFENVDPSVYERVNGWVIKNTRPDADESNQKLVFSMICLLIVLGAESAMSGCDV